MKKLLLMSMALIAATPLARAQYTFGTQQQSTPSASTTYNSGTGAFQYTDSANLTDDDALLPLTGSAANLVTTSTGWTASINVNLSARSMTSTSSDANIYTPDNGVAIGILATVGSDSYLVSISLAQDNDTGGTGNTDTPNYFYGTMARFEADKNGVGQSTTPLGSSVTQMGTSCLELSGGTSSTISSQSISAATGVVTISYNASTNIVTGYYNGTPVGSYSIASFGSNQLTLGVGGYSGEGVNVTAGTDTATNFFVDPFSGTVTATGLSKSPWFGHYSISSYPVVYQYNLGYEYVFPVNGGVGGVYLYDYTSGHFWYTQASYFPYLYDSSLNTFLYYYQANTPHRHFYDFGTGQVITL